VPSGPCAVCPPTKMEMEMESSGEQGVGEFANDTLVDFSMRWIRRNDDPETSAAHFFTTHFFTALDEGGPAAVSSWTAKKNIDIFKKRFVFIPINESLHWSLCVVVNPGAIPNEYVLDEDDQSDDQDDFPCILFLDMLKKNRKTSVANTVREWLNHEAKRLGKFTELFETKNPKLFNKLTMEVIHPKVPCQDDGWESSVFVCRCACALYLMRNKQITYEAAGVESRPYFDNLITNCPEFKFNMCDIGRVGDERIWEPSNTLSADMLKMIDSADASNSDVVFQIGKGRKTKKKKGKELFHAHRNIILARAPILASLTEDIEDGTPIPVEDVDPGIFRMLLRFVYGGEVPPKDVLKDEARTLIRAADRFGVTGLKLSAEVALASSGINVENCAELILFADGTNCAMLKEAAMDYFVTNSVEIMASDGYKDVKESPDILQELLLAMSAGGKKRPASGNSNGDFKRMRVSTLRHKLDKKGLDVDGSKDMLVARLENAVAGGDTGSGG